MSSGRARELQMLLVEDNVACAAQRLRLKLVLLDELPEQRK
jgi:hypothetical protein